MTSGISSTITIYQHVASIKEKDESGVCSARYRRHAAYGKTFGNTPSTIMLLSRWYIESGKHEFKTKVMTTGVICLMKKSLPGTRARKVLRSSMRKEKCPPYLTTTNTSRLWVRKKAIRLAPSLFRVGWLIKSNRATPAKDALSLSHQRQSVCIIIMNAVSVPIYYAQMILA